MYVCCMFHVCVLYMCSRMCVVCVFMYISCMFHACVLYVKLHSRVNRYNVVSGMHNHVVCWQLFVYNPLS